MTELMQLSSVIPSFFVFPLDSSSPNDLKVVDLICMYIYINIYEYKYIYKFNSHCVMIIQIQYWEIISTYPQERIYSLRILKCKFFRQTNYHFKALLIINESYPILKSLYHRFTHVSPLTPPFTFKHIFLDVKKFILKSTSLFVPFSLKVYVLCGSDKYSWRCFLWFAK